MTSDQLTKAYVANFEKLLHGEITSDEAKQRRREIDAEAKRNEIEPKGSDHAQGLPDYLHTKVAGI